MADLTVTAASVLRSSGEVVVGTAGATITQGMALYFDTSTGTWKLALQGTLAASGGGAGGQVGIALTAGSSGQPVVVQLNGSVNVGATLTVGLDYYVGAAGGGICPRTDLAQNEWVTYLGTATTAALLKLNPNISGVQVP